MKNYTKKVRKYQTKMFSTKKAQKNKNYKNLKKMNK